LTLRGKGRAGGRKELQKKKGSMVTIRNKRRNFQAGLKEPDLRCLGT